MATTVVVDPNESVQGSLTALTTVMLTIATTAVVLRCWAVYADPARKLGLDDIFATASLVSAPEQSTILLADNSISLSTLPNALWCSGGYH